MPKPGTRQQSAPPNLSDPADELRILRAASRMIGVGMIAVDVRADDQPIVYVNEGFEELTGYRAQELLGRNCRLLQGPSTDRRQIDAVRSAIGRGMPYRGKLLNYRKDGSKFWNLLHIAPLKDGDGRITHFIGVQSDATDETESSRRLEEALAVERVISSTSRILARRPEGSIRHNLDEALTVIGSGLGVDRVALVEFTPPGADPHVKDVYAVDGLPQIPSPVERNLPWCIGELRAGRTVVIPSPEALPAEAENERSYMCRTGLKANCSLPIIIGDAVLGALALSDFRRERDWPEHVLQRLVLLSEIIGNTLARERSHQALKESEALMRSMSDALPVCIAFVDPERRYRFNNSTYEKWFQVSRSRLAGQKVEKVLGAEAYRAVRHHVDRALAGVATHFETEIPYKTAGTRQVEVDYVPHFGDDRNVKGFFALIQDVTARRQADMEAQSMRDQLAHVSRVASMGELTATLAHELNQPLSAILSNAQAALRELSSETPGLDDVRSALADVVADDKRAGAVVRRVMSFLRPRDEHRERASLNVVVEEVIKLLRNEIRKRGVSLGTGFTQRLPPVLVDRIQIQQIVMNLLLNALDAVESACPQKLVEVRTERCGRSTVAVSVHDNGPGIDADQASRIFEPFYSTKAAGGFGMGLAISRAIAEAHGGKLTVAESGGTGATLRLELPVADGAR